MEQKANELFSRYAKLYYDSNYLTSVYFFDTDQPQGFGCCWLVKKTKDNENGIDEGTWDAIHLVTATVDDKQKVKYRVISTIFLFIKATNDKQGVLDVAGNINKIREDYVAIDPKYEIDQFHLKNIGRLIETNESEIR
mmetsp:Transcript_16023/g.24866  ORF Transcript_16023/g.24866 Transcript_16023/m.24866 type:complete len:138 (-) Transcript_16023:168-581(-)